MSSRYTSEELDYALRTLLYASLRGEYTHPADERPKKAKKRIKVIFDRDMRTMAKILRLESNEKQNSLLKGTPRFRQIHLH